MNDSPDPQIIQLRQLIRDVRGDWLLEGELGALDARWVLVDGLIARLIEQYPVLVEGFPQTGSSGA